MLEPHLDERQRRLVLAARARSLGRGGISRIALAAGVHPSTVSKGIEELESPGARPHAYGVRAVAASGSPRPIPG
ncbi:hypothetical protein [Micromonospora echinospora]|uniref:hypothetical protein n=1 Tax=Micromonospora echinospora TaxID=1877 RepID=UPI003A87FD32